MKTQVKREYVVQVEACDRCGADHENMMFQPLANPQDEYAYYGLCPDTLQPVLMTAAEMGE